MSDSLPQPNQVTFSSPGDKRRLIGQKPPLKPEQLWSIRVGLQVTGKKRDLARLRLAIDSKLRGYDLVIW